MLFGPLASMFSNDLAVDLGPANTLAGLRPTVSAGYLASGVGGGRERGHDGLEADQRETRQPVCSSNVVISRLAATLACGLLMNPAVLLVVMGIDVSGLGRRD